MHLPFRVGMSPTLKIRGLIATRAIKKGEVLEQCPLILVPMNQEHGLLNTLLRQYYFEWNKTHHAVVLGYGSLYNHSFEPNVRYAHNYKTRTMNFRAITAVKTGEELTINYNFDPHDKTPLDPHHR